MLDPPPRSRARGAGVAWPEGRTVTPRACATGPLHGASRKFSSDSGQQGAGIGHGRSEHPPRAARGGCHGIVSVDTA